MCEMELEMTGEYLTSKKTLKATPEMAGKCHPTQDG